MTIYWTSSNFVKICGICLVDDALAACEASADAIGLIFADSPRAVDLNDAIEISRRIDSEVGLVGVFRDLRDDEILSVISALAFDAVQIHDELSSRLENELRERNVAIIKALSVNSRDFDEFDDERVEAVLIDGPRAGSGEEHSWDRLGERDFHVPVIAAGGLHSRNVADVIRHIRPWGVDTASGVELRPGVKDHQQVEEFVRRARSAFEEVGELS